MSANATGRWAASSKNGDSRDSHEEWKIVATVGGLGSVNIASLFPTSYALRECFILGVRYARIRTS